ncbi:hypothetical protein [Phascolarctobacterium sp.]
MALLTGTAINLARLQQSTLSSTNSNSIVLQAYQYAESKVDIMTLKGYKNLTAQAKTKIEGTDYQDEVQVSQAITLPDGSQRKTVTTNVYLNNEKSPRASIKKFFYSISPEGIDIGSPEYLGATDGGSFSGIAKTAGFIVAAGSNKPRSLNVYVDGKLLGYVVPRGYGTGDIQVCVPVPKNSSWSVSGKCSWAYWMPLKS